MAAVSSSSRIGISKGQRGGSSKGLQQLKEGQQLKESRSESSSSPAAQGVAAATARVGSIGGLRKGGQWQGVVYAKDVNYKGC
jgi:hypothetical protein